MATKNSCPNKQKHKQYKLTSYTHAHLQKSINTYEIKTFHSESAHIKRIFVGAGQRVKIQCHETFKVPEMFFFHTGMKTKLLEHFSDLELCQKLLFSD